MDRLHQKFSQLKIVDGGVNTFNSDMQCSPTKLSRKESHVCKN